MSKILYYYNIFSPRATQFLIRKLKYTLLNSMASTDKRLTREAYANFEKDKFLQMPLAEKRNLYKCGNSFVVIENIPTWRDVDIVSPQNADPANGKVESTEFSPDSNLNGKISLWRGDITTLEIDGIVNAANKTLLGGGGVDGAIHKAAGPSLRTECQALNGCETGVAKVTGGYRLPAKYVVHTVGPIGENQGALAACYKNSLSAAVQQGIRTIAFPCISTGVYGYPNDRACQVALETTRKWLEENSASSLDRIIFCVFLQTDLTSYNKWLHAYFPK